MIVTISVLLLYCQYLIFSAVCIVCDVNNSAKCVAALIPDILAFRLCEVGVEAVAQVPLHKCVQHLPKGSKNNWPNYDSLILMFFICDVSHCGQCESHPMSQSPGEDFWVSSLVGLEKLVDKVLGHESEHQTGSLRVWPEFDSFKKTLSDLFGIRKDGFACAHTFTHMMQIPTKKKPQSCLKYTAQQRRLICGHAT